MSSLQPPPLLKSPVWRAFDYIQWDKISGIELTDDLVHLIHELNHNRIEQTLEDSNKASEFVNVLFHLLIYASKAGAGNAASNASPSLTLEEYLEILRVDEFGVVLHYAIYRLYKIIIGLKENKQGPGVTFRAVFYEGGRDAHISHWNALRFQYKNQDDGNRFSQTCASFILAQILIECDCNCEAIQLLTDWTIYQLIRPDTSIESIEIVLPAFMALMHEIEPRAYFSKIGGLEALGHRMAHTLKKVKGSAGNEITALEQLYKLTNCLYLMTGDVNELSHTRDNFVSNRAVKILCQIVKSLTIAHSVDDVSKVFSTKTASETLSALINLAMCQDLVDGKTFTDHMLKYKLYFYIKQKELKNCYAHDNSVKRDIKKLQRRLKKAKDESV